MARAIWRIWQGEPFESGPSFAFPNRSNHPLCTDAGGYAFRNVSAIFDVGRLFLESSSLIGEPTPRRPWGFNITTEAQRDFGQGGRAANQNRRY